MFTEGDADEMITRAYFDAAERLLGWPAVGEPGWTLLTQRTEAERRELYLTCLRLERRRAATITPGHGWGVWARRFGATNGQLAEAAGIPENEAADLFHPV